MKSRLWLSLLLLCALLLCSCAAEDGEPFFSMTDTVSSVDSPETLSDAPSDTEESEVSSEIGTEESSRAPATDVGDEESSAPDGTGGEGESKEDALTGTEESDAASEDADPPTEHPLPSPDELLSRLGEVNRISSLMADGSDVLLTALDTDRDGIERRLRYSVKDSSFLIEESHLSAMGEPIFSHVAWRGACYTQVGETLSFAILPDFEEDTLLSTFGVPLFAPVLQAESCLAEEGFLRLVSVASENAHERVEYVYTANAQDLRLQTLEILWSTDGTLTRKQTVAVSLCAREETLALSAYHAHQISSDALRLYVTEPSGTRRDAYTVSASAVLSVSPASDGTPYALYKNKECTKNVTELSEYAGTDAYVYLGAWQGEISLEYRLTEEELDTFLEMVAGFRTLALEGASAARVLAAANELDAFYEYLDAQMLIAYVHYYSALSDPVAQSRFILSQSICGEASAALYAAYAEIAASDAPIRTLLFADWSDEEIAALGVDRSAISALEEENAALITEYHSLEEGNAWESEVNRIYGEFVANNTEIARLSGYENYYEYATDAYARDYGAQERALFREYVKTYVTQLFEEVQLRLNGVYAVMNATQRAQLSSFYGDALAEDAIARSYIDAYVASLTPSLARKMQAMFEKDVITVGRGEDSYAGAFTTYLTLYEEPIAYFGTGCSDALTVIHENGHYAAYCSLASPDAPSLDLCETHSQGNEWLFIAYLDGKLDPLVHEALTLDRLLNGLSIMIYATAVDECEETLYAAQTPYGAEEYDAVLNGVISSYGAFANGRTDHLREYFKRVALNSPVYYISYATSEMASVSLYLLADEDYSAAQAAYTALVDGASAEDGFLTSLEEVGLLTPFEEESFLILTERFSSAALEEAA